jgi:hypothetical protein
MEIIVTVALTGILVVALVKMLAPMARYFQNNRARQTAQMEARRCMGMIQRVMANGKINPLDISTPTTTPRMPFSQAQFSDANGSAYVITWSTAPPNSVHLIRTTAGGAVTDTILATHVSGLNFTFDSDQPTAVQVTLQIMVPLNSYGRADDVYTLLLPIQPISMLAS